MAKKPSLWEDGKWDDDPLFANDSSYYEEEVLPRIERQALAEKAKCKHEQFYIYCSTCRHVLGSEVNDPYEVLKAHRAKHAGEGNFDNNSGISI
jgi:hypothetical protein